MAQTRVLIGQDNDNTSGELIALLKKHGIKDNNFITQDSKHYLRYDNTYICISGGVDNRIFLLYDPCVQNGVKGIAEISYDDDCVTSIKIYKNIDNELPSSLMHETEEELKQQFLAAHDLDYAQAQTACFFGGCRKSRLVDGINTADLTLKQIVEHGLSSNNRTRKVMTNLGWFSLNTRVPAIIGNIILGNAIDYYLDRKESETSIYQNCS